MKKAFIDDGHSFLERHRVSRINQVGATRPLHSGHGLDAGDRTGRLIGQLIAGGGNGGRLSVKCPMFNHPIDPVGVTVISVERQLVKNIEANEQETHEAKGEARDVEGTVKLTSQHISPAGFQVIEEHIGIVNGIILLS